MALIKFNNFSFRYKGNIEYALNTLNLEIKDNSFILLAGETGSGKTSLIRCLNGLIPQFYAGYYKGSVEIAGKSTITTPISDLSTEVGIVFQNPENQLVAMNVEHEIAFGMENLGISSNEIKKRIKEVVKLTEIQHLLERAPFEISGGEKQRVAIASVLVLDPKILILDEPTANLDPFFAKKIIMMLKKIQETKNISVIISEHRMDLLVPLVDRIILMESGKVVAFDDTNVVLNSEIFHNLNINKPKIYSLFKELENRNKRFSKIPLSVEEALNLFRQYT
ncbi:MAG: ABC transporter ATP-binding protein [Promethearchaeota archaeon]|nr:MAG: ABC transporter ATP-binding protein [Candidatus Lokiarchaeota archaeon]